MTIRGNEKHTIAQEGRSTIGGAALRAQGAIPPYFTSRDGVKSKHFIAAGRVHNAVYDDRHGFQVAWRVDVTHPFGGQLRDCPSVDLRERAVAVGKVVAD